MPIIVVYFPTVRFIYKHITLLILVLFTTNTARAQDSSCLFVLDAQDLAIANAQNLEEALMILPGMHHYIQNMTSQTSFGTISVEQIAIFKNDIPLALDQNVGFNLRAIPVWDIERIEMFVASMGTLVKNSSTLIIKLYTPAYKKQSIWGSTHLVTSAVNDLSTRIEVGASNIKHNINIGANRTFQSALYETDGVRNTFWGGEERLDLNLRYRYNIVGSVVLDIQSDNTRLESRNKGPVLTNTTRVRDLNSSFRNHSISSSLFAPISKTHSIRLSGKIHRFNDEHKLLDKDLNSGITQENTAIKKKLSTGYDYGYMRLELSSKNKKLDYCSGIELSNTRDNTFSNINAIATEYSDYTAFANFQYQQRNTVLLTAGAKLLTNSLSGSYFMPYASVVLAPKTAVRFSGSYIRSLSYPNFSAIFYDANMNHGVSGNIQLSPIIQNTIGVNLKLGDKTIQAQSGLLYIQSNNVVQITKNATFENTGRSSTTTLYTVVRYKDQIWDIRPHIVLHSNNFVRDSLGISFVHPQIGITAKAKIPKIGTTLGLLLRNSGTNTILSRNTDVIYQTDINAFSNTSLYISQPLLHDKLQITLGINNIGNATLVELNRYRREEINNILEESSSVLSARNKAFTIRINYYL